MLHDVHYLVTNFVSFRHNGLLIILMLDNGDLIVFSALSRERKGRKMENACFKSLTFQWSVKTRGAGFVAFSSAGSGIGSP